MFNAFIVAMLALVKHVRLLNVPVTDVNAETKHTSAPKKQQRGKKCNWRFGCSNILFVEII